MNLPTLRTVLLTLLATNVAVAAPPVLKGLRPAGARRGTPVVIEIGGEALAGAELFSDLPAAAEVVTSGANSASLKLQFLPGAPVGVYPIRLQTPGGLSNPLLLSVGDLPEVAETEPNDGPSPGSPLTLPFTANGDATAGDRDFYPIAALAGQRITVEVEAARLGSNLDALVRVVDARERELALNDDAPGLGADCRVQFVVPEDGTYFVVVQDAKFKPGTPSFYRVKVGTFPYADGIFPLGWRRGETVPVHFVGGTLIDPVAGQASTVVPAWLDWTMVAAPSRPGRVGTLPMRFFVGDDPEVLEPDSAGVHAMATDTVVNGRLSAPGEVDRYRLAVAPGQKWAFEIQAAELGSALDAVLTVEDASGGLLATADDGDGLDPRLTFEVPAGHNEVVLAIEDLIGRGGPTFAYRLRATRPKRGFAIEVITPAVNIPQQGTTNVEVRVTREQYDGPIQLSIGEELEGVSASGGLIPAGKSEGFLTLSAATGARRGVFDLTISGQGGPATKPIRRTASGNEEFPPARTRHGELVNVPAVITEPLPVTLAAAGRLQLVQGHTVELKVSVERKATATEAIMVTSTLLPAQVTEGTGTIAKDATQGTVKFQVGSNAPLGSSVLLLSGTTTVDGIAEKISLAPIEAEVIRPFSLEILTQPVIISVGSKVSLTGVLRRAAPFSGEVAVAPDEGSSPRITCSSATLNSSQSLVELELAAEAMAEPGEYNLRLKGTTELNGTYILRDINVPVKVVAAADTDQ